MPSGCVVICTASCGVPEPGTGIKIRSDIDRGAAAINAIQGSTAPCLTGGHDEGGH